MGEVLGDLAAAGFDAEWASISAAEVGAPHLRERVWIVAYPNGEGEHDGAVDAEVASASQPLADTERTRLEGLGSVAGQPEVSESRDRGVLADTTYQRHERTGSARQGGLGPADGGGGGLSEWWAAEPSVGRVAYGVPARVERLRALGNSLVPQIAQWIGERILEWEDRRVRAGR